MTSTTSDRRTGRCRASLALSLAALLASAPTPARADASERSASDAEATQDEAVRALIRQGEQLFVQRRYSEAMAAYRRAYDQTGAHGLLYMLARCHEELGELEAAIDLFEKFLLTSPPPEVRGKASGALRLLRQRITESRLVLQVAPFGATVVVDGQVVGVAPVEPRIVTPGWHDIEVRHPGYAAARERVQVRGGREATVAVELAPEAPDRKHLRPWIWASAGVGGALAVGGTIAWLLGESDHAAVDDGDLTQREAYALAADGDTKKTAGAVLWLGSLAAGGAAVVLAILEREDGATRTRSSATVTAAPVRGGGAVMVEGRFW